MSDDGFGPAQDARGGGDGLDPLLAVHTFRTPRIASLDRVGSQVCGDRHIGRHVDAMLRGQREKISDRVGSGEANRPMDQDGLDGFLGCLLRIETEILEEDLWAGWLGDGAREPRCGRAEATRRDRSGRGTQTPYTTRPSWTAGPMIEPILSR